MPRLTTIATPVAHVVGPGKIKIVNGRLAFATEGAGPIRLETKCLRFLFCYGPVGVTDDAMTTLFQCEIETAWFSQRGARCRGRLVRADPKTTSLRIRQHRAALDPSFRCQAARGWVALKIDSQIAASRHAQRHGIDSADTLALLQEHRAAVDKAPNVDTLRGLEGAASAVWFQLVPRLLRSPWTFSRRSRRPPTDPVNALLSLGYTLLAARAVAVCEAFGLEVYLGALREFRPGRPSLACDVIEPLRVPAVDRWAIALLNRGSLKIEDFFEQNNGYRLQPAAFQRTLQFWETEWINGGHETQLHRLIQEFMVLLRRFARDEPEAENPSAASD